MKIPESLSSPKVLSPLILALLTIAPTAVQAQTQDFWLGGTADFNVATNWSLNAIPTNGYSANNDTGANNAVLINAGDPPWTLNGFRDGVSAGGAFIQNGSTVTLGSTQNGWLRMGINATGVGVYTINSNAILNTPFGATVGELGAGTLNVYGGTITMGTGNTFIVNSNGVSGTVNQTNGTITVGSQTWVGQGVNGQAGAYNFSGGTLNANNFLAVGRDAGQGTFTMTGGILNKNGTGNILVGTTANLGSPNAGVGTFTQSAGTINCSGQFLVPEQSPATGTYNLSGTGALFCNNWIAIGRGGIGTLNMSGGMIVKTDTGEHFDVGAGGAQGGGSTGTINQTGGIITNTTSDFWLGEAGGGTWNISGSAVAYLGNLKICVNNGIQSTLNLNGGQITTLSIGSPAGVASSSTLNFNGGILQASQSSATFISGLTVASIEAGGAIIDTQGFNATIPQPLYDGGGGGIVKLGSGALTLSGANGYVGATIVSNGTLITTTASSGGGAFTVNDGTTFGVNIAFAGTTLSASTLTLGNSTGATLNLNLGNFGNPSPTPITAGTLALNGATTVNVQDSAPVAGQFPLISYTTLSGSGSLVLGTLTSGITASLSNNAANNSIDLVITSAGAPRWNGNVSSVWDILTTPSWVDLGSQQSVTYRDGEPVLFDDNATDATAITLSTTVRPAGILATNNTLPYSISGSGQIAGATGLLIEGSNTFAISTTNTYTGSTGISNGTLIVSTLANGGSPSSIGASSASASNLVIGAATLSYTGPAVSINRGFALQGGNSTIDIEGGNLTVSGAIAPAAGSGFIKTGPGQLTIATPGTNELSGGVDPGVQAQNGTLVLDGSNGGQTNHSLFELWVGDKTNAPGAVILTNSTLNVDSWLAVGRGNGPSNFLSTFTLYNSTASFGNVSLGYANGIPGNLAQQALTLHGASVLVDNGVMNLSESGGSTGAITLLDTSVLLGGNQAFYIGTGGNAIGSLTIANSAKVIWKTNSNTFWFDVGNAGGTGSLLIRDNGSLATAGDFNVTDGGTSTGTALVQDNGQINVNNIFVTKVAGATGVFTISNNATVYSSNGCTIAANNTANGTVNLDGGALAVNLVQGNSSTTPNGVFNFNGGTLIAHQPYFGNFMYYLSAANVQAGGAKIDVGTNSVQITQALLDGGGNGGLTLFGSGGTLFLNGANTYTGLTTINSGATLGGTGSIAGSVAVNSGGSILADNGSGVGTFYINGTLTLAAGSASVFKITPASNDQIAGLAGVNYGGALIVTNTSSNAIAPGSLFKLFNSASLGGGNFSSIIVLPSGTGTFNPATGTLTIGSAATPPTINPPTVSGGNLILSGTGGTAGSGYTVLSTTNLAIPVANWTTNTTGVFSGTGTFLNSIPLGAAPLFFEIRTP